MLGTYFYHEIIRKTVVAFGTLFNQVYVAHENNSNQVISKMKVPLAYGPMQKFLARIEQQAELNKAVQLTLPRMSFEMNGIQYDSTRKTSVTQTFKAVDNNSRVKKVFMPVPYNLGFELNILTKLNDDALQILEQILPFFQPSFNVTIDLVDSIGEKRDIPVVLENISFQDDYEGDFTTRRALIYTLQFSVKTYLFGPIADSTDGLIKKVQVDYYSNTDVQNARRQVRYVATPIAKKDYNDDNSSSLSEDLTTQETLVGVTSTSLLSVGDRVIIDSEIMKIKSKTSDSITVVRGYNDTIAATHTTGTSIDVLSEADNTAIVVGDDFGFSEETSFFQDAGEYSNTRNTDLI
jgi:hypothetical protein